MSDRLPRPERQRRQRKGVAHRELAVRQRHVEAGADAARQEARQRLQLAENALQRIERCAVVDGEFGEAGLAAVVGGETADRSSADRDRRAEFRDRDRKRDRPDGEPPVAAVRIRQRMRRIDIEADLGRLVPGAAGLARRRCRRRSARPAERRYRAALSASSLPVKSISLV